MPCAEGPFSCSRVPMRVTDILGCVGGALVLMYVAVWIPLLGPLLMFLSPLLFLTYATKLGLQQGAVLAGLSVMAVVVVSTLTGHRQAIVFCIEFSVLGIVLSELFRRNLSLTETITAALAAMALFGFLILFGIGAARGLGPSEIIAAIIREQLQATVQLYHDMGAPVENAGEANDYAEMFIQTVSRIYPSLMVIGMGLVVVMNVMFARPLFRKIGLDYPAFQPADRWQAPEKLIWAVIAAGFGSLLASGTMQMAAINVLFVLSAVYFFQGLSIGFYYLNKYRVPLLIRAVLYLLILFQQFLMLLLALVGLFDQWLDFRRLRSDRTE